jgi:predicted transcriptional regulator
MNNKGEDMNNKPTNLASKYDGIPEEIIKELEKDDAEIERLKKEFDALHMELAEERLRFWERVKDEIKKRKTKVFDKEVS